MITIKQKYNENVTLEFIYTEVFDKIWSHYGLTHEDRKKLEVEIKQFEETNTNSSVVLGDIIRDTSGAIKYRFQRDDATKGKSGGFRIIYCKFARRIYAFLLIYGKSDKENLTTKEKKMISKTIEQIKKGGK